MPESLPYQSQIDVASNQVGCQRVFESMWMALLHCQPSFLSNRLEHTKELGTVEPAAFLARE